MSENTVLGSLPNSRPNRRSSKREPAPALRREPAGAADAEPDAAGAEPGAVAAAAHQTPGSQARTPERPDTVALAVQASAELAAIAISASARALRATVARLPRT